jgi:hypothetical protein
VAGDGGDDARHVAAHAEALVADPVALHEVVGAAGTRGCQRADEDRQRDLVRERPEARHDLGRVLERRHLDRGEQRDDDEHQDRDDLEELKLLDGLVDDGRRGQDRADHEQADDRDRVRVAAADRERGDGRGGGRPSGPHRGEDRAEREDRAPRLPQPLEAAERRLAGGQRVALDLHVDEELEGHADDRGPQERETGLRGDVGVEDVLAAGDADADEDHARSDQLAQRRRSRELALLGSRAPEAPGGSRGGVGLCEGRSLHVSPPGCR